MLSALLASAIVTLTIPAPPKIDVEKMLDAIAGAEAWDGKTVGKAGEWSAYQLTPAVWKHCRGTLNKSMRQATPSELRAAAREELQFRIVTLEINHITPTPFLCGLAWSAGVSSVLRNTASQAKLDYATRTANLYSDSLKVKAAQR